MNLIKIIRMIWKSIMPLQHYVNNHTFMVSEVQNTYHRATAYEHLAANQRYRVGIENAFNQQLHHYQRNAIWFFLHAALKGYSRAQYKLGMLYLHGQLGLDSNTLKAQKWLVLAANQGHVEAQKQLNALPFFRQ